MAKIRTSFVTLVLFGLIFTNRSWSKNIFSMKVKNSALWWIVSGALIFLILPVLSNNFARYWFVFVFFCCSSQYYLF